MKKYLEERVITKLIDINNRRGIILGIGFATFFFGFFAGGALHAYLIFIGSSFVQEFRGSLTYVSAIFGDGILLPVLNMMIAGFLLDRKHLVHRKIIYAALVLGFAITAYFHVAQAVGGIINWAMPAPWQWNILGLWHGAYMFSVASFLSLFYLVVVGIVRKERHMPKEFFIVTAGLIFFFLLLRFDYMTVSLNSLVPGL